MIDILPTPPPHRATTKMVCSTGRLKNDAFLLRANHVMLEFDSATFDLVGAVGEGGVEVRMISPDHFDVYVALAQTALYRPQEQMLILGGWTGSHFLGHQYPPNESGELILPTDGTFFPSPDDLSSTASDAISGPHEATTMTA